MNLTIDDIRKFVKEGENQITEFKKRVDKNSISMHVAAFANTEGGIIVYGYDENEKAFTGVSNNEIKQIEHFISEDVMGHLCEGNIIEIEGKMVYAISVKKSRELVLANGVLYVRHGERVVIPDSKDVMKKICEQKFSGKTERDYLEKLLDGQKVLYEQNVKLKELLEAEKKARNEDVENSRKGKWKSLAGGFIMGIVTGVVANYVYSYLTTGSFSEISVLIEFFIR